MEGGRLARNGRVSCPAAIAAANEYRGASRTAAAGGTPAVHSSPYTKSHVQTATVATAATKSAISAAGTACRVFRTLTAPK